MHDLLKELDYYPPYLHTHLDLVVEVLERKAARARGFKADRRACLLSWFRTHSIRATPTAQGRLLSVTDPLNHQTTFTSNANGQCRWLWAVL